MKIREIPGRIKTAGPAKLLRIGASRCFAASAYRITRAAIDDFGAVQRTWELLNLVKEVKRLRPELVIEIGTKEGGTLYCWAQASQPATTLISVDLPGGQFGGGYSESQVEFFNGFLHSRQRLHCVRSDSHLPSTRNIVSNLCSGRMADFLFIDGDHTFAGVKQDFETYSPLVRPGGLVAFHDIVEDPGIPASQVFRFWNELKFSHECAEYVDRASEPQHGMGVGIVRMKS